MQPNSVRPKKTAQMLEPYHVLHKLPPGDTAYVRAKHLQVPLFFFFFWFITVRLLFVLWLFLCLEGFSSSFFFLEKFGSVSFMFFKTQQEGNHREKNIFRRMQKCFPAVFRHRSQDQFSITGTFLWSLFSCLEYECHVLFLLGLNFFFFFIDKKICVGRVISKPKKPQLGLQV